MAKAAITTEIITNPVSLSQDRVVRLVVSNYATTDTTFTFRGVKRFLPAFDVLPQQPFEFSLNGHDFKADLIFTESSTNIVVDIAYLIDETTSKC